MNIPNLLTFIRFILIFPFSYYLCQGDNIGVIISLIIYIVATITDYLDGYIARKYNIVTKIGAFLDPLADKLLVMTGFIIFSIKGYVYLPLIFILILAFREIYITILRVEIKYAKDDEKNGKKELKTSFAAKIKTTIQMLTLIVFYLFLLMKINNYEISKIISFIPFLLFLICIYFAYSSGIKYVKACPVIARNTLIKFFSTTFYTGFFPKMPGTFSSFVVILIFYFIQLNYWMLFVILSLVIIIGILVSSFSERVFNKKDPSVVTIDEAAGIILSLFPYYIFQDSLENTIYKSLYFVAAFVLFRFFDIVKPLGINKSQNIGGGIGIMIDDLIAGIYSSLILYLAIYFII